MKTTFTPSLILLLAFAGFTACQQDKPAPQEQQAENLISAAKTMEKAINKQMGESLENGETIEPADFRKMKELLPESVLGMPRTKHEGQKAGALGMKFSSAEAAYKDNTRRLSIKLIDAASIGMASLGFAAWTTLEIDRETQEGHEKTYNWNGFKVYETVANTDKIASLKLYSEKGIIAELEASNISIDDLKKIAKDLNLESIAGMR